MVIMYIKRTRQIKIMACTISLHYTMRHMCPDLQRSRATEVQPAVPGYTAACIQNPAITVHPRASLTAIHSCNGASHGPPTGVFSIIAHQLTLRVVHGQIAKNTCGGMRNSKSGPVWMYRTFR